MGRVVKLLGSGIGLATEAIAARRSPSPSPSAAASSSGEVPSDDPPPYASLRGEHDGEPTAEGQRVPADRKTRYEDEVSESSGEEGDEADWDLDDAGDDMAGSKAFSPTEQPQGTVNGIVHAFISRYPAP